MADVLAKNRVRIDELSEVTDIKETDLIDVTNANSSYKFQIANFSQANGKIVNDAAAYRYKTEDNNLSPNDLALFYNYNQGSSTKSVYFESTPIVDTYKDVTDLEDNSLLTKYNGSEFENYLSKLEKFPCSVIPALNWENEKDISVITDISDFIPTTVNEERATYKIPYDSTESNEVNMSNFVKDSRAALEGVFYYSVAGLVSIKSKIPEQRSGTIYLEARPANNDEAAWITIDSAVFKFVDNNDTKSPGTYVVLNGYISTDFVTRLKLNLNPQGYSMNLNDYRLSDSALVTNHVNTFVGFAYFPANKDGNWKIPDYSQYYNIKYYFPGKKLSGISPEITEHLTEWIIDERPYYEDLDLDEGPNELDGERPKTDRVTWVTPNAPPQYRHTRWVNVTEGFSHNEYLPSATINLTPENCKLITSDNTYEFAVEAKYEQIWYDVIYRPGIAESAWTSYTYTKKPMYDYVIDGQWNERNSGKKYSSNYGITYIKAKPYEDYYRHIYWKNKNRNNQLTDFLSTIDLTDTTTRPAPGTTDPAVNRQLIFEAEYVPVRYKIIYTGGEAAEAGAEPIWPNTEPCVDFGSNGGEYPGYKYLEECTLKGKVPVLGYGNRSGFIRNNKKQIRIHYEWEINGSKTTYHLKPGEKIKVSDDYVKQSDIDKNLKNFKRDAWEIKVNAKYRSPFKIILVANGGVWKNWGGSYGANANAQWNPENYGGLNLSSYIGKTSNIVIENPNFIPVNDGDGHYHEEFILPGVIGIKSNLYPQNGWTCLSHSGLSVGISQGTLNNPNSRKITLPEYDPNRGEINEIIFYASYEQGPTGGVPVSGNSVKCDNQKSGGSCGSRLHWNYDEIYATPHYTFHSAVLIDYNKSFSEIAGAGPVTCLVTASLEGCHHERPWNRHVDIYFPGGSTWKPRGPTYDSGSEQKPWPRTYGDAFYIYNVPCVGGSRYGGQIKWYNLHHLIATVRIAAIII